MHCANVFLIQSISVFIYCCCHGSCWDWWWRWWWQVMTMRCQSREEPEEEAVEARMVDTLLPPYFPVKKDGAPRVTMSSAISLVNRWQLSIADLKSPNARSNNDNHCLSRCLVSDIKCRCKQSELNCCFLYSVRISCESPICLMMKSVTPIILVTHLVQTIHVPHVWQLRLLVLRKPCVTEVSECLHCSQVLRKAAEWFVHSSHPEVQDNGGEGGWGGRGWGGGG